jgi:hypothetical protein
MVIYTSRPRHFTAIGKHRVYDMAGEINDMTYSYDDLKQGKIAALNKEYPPKEIAIENVGAILYIASSRN